MCLELSPNIVYINDRYQRSVVAMSSTAKIFMTGRSQAVRLPKEFRFEGSQVKIRREGNAVVLEPMSSDWAWLDALPDTVDSDFVDSVLDRPTKQQDRPDLEFFE